MSEKIGVSVTIFAAGTMQTTPCDCEQASSVSLSTAIGVTAVIVAVVFSAVGFTVGMLAGTCWSKRHQHKDITSTQISQPPAVLLSSAHPVPSAQVIPEYEEINLSESKLKDIKVTENAAYGVTT